MRQGIVPDTKEGVEDHLIGDADRHDSPYHPDFLKKFLLLGTEDEDLLGFA